MAASQLPNVVAEYLSANSIRLTDRAIVGLSGGVDSVTLYHVLRDGGMSVHAVHVNYGFRGDESERDEALVRELVDGADLTVFNPSESETLVKGKSLQESARDYRYQKFSEVARIHAIKYVFLGHHADDNAETVLMNLFRGTGVEGLAGIPPRRTIRRSADDGIEVIRPMLTLTRAEVLDYAVAEGFAWHDDQSNPETKYGRGYIRTVVRPVIEEKYGNHVFANINKSSAIVRGYVEADFKPTLDHLVDEVIEDDSRIHIERLQSLEGVWQRRVLTEAIRRWYPHVSAGHNAVERIVRLLSSQTGKKVIIQSLCVTRDRDHLSFTVGEKSSSTETLSLDIGREIAIGKSVVRVDALARVPADVNTLTPFNALIDAGGLPLFARVWQDGDRIQLLGSMGTTKVSDVLTDRKVSTSVRAGQLVVLSGTDIIWIPGVAQSELHKISKDTSEVVLLTYINPTHS